jgi:Helicase associated domain
MQLTHKDRWEQGFAALCKFRKRKGHCCPPQVYVEGKYNLGSWAITLKSPVPNKAYPVETSVLANGIHL